jgi:hypothetical protein
MSQKTGFRPLSNAAVNRAIANTLKELSEALRLNLAGFAIDAGSQSLRCSGSNDHPDHDTIAAFISSRICLSVRALD